MPAGVGPDAADLSDPTGWLADQIGVSRETVAPLEGYEHELVRWQTAKNLIANSTLPDRWTRHFLDSAQLYPLIVADHGPGPHCLLDIGSGAGFPGLVLAAMGVADAHMVESNGRKASFMAHIARTGGCRATIHHARIEDLTPFHVKLVTARACAPLSRLLSWAAPFMTDETHFYLLKGEKAEQELTEASASWNMTVVQHRSVTDPTGVILHLSHVTPHQ